MGVTELTLLAELEKSLFGGSDGGTFSADTPADRVFTDDFRLMKEVRWSESFKPPIIDPVADAVRAAVEMMR